MDEVRGFERRNVMSTEYANRFSHASRRRRYLQLARGDPPARRH
jgi:hypothetical protein